MVDSIIATAFALCAAFVTFALTSYAGKQFDRRNTVAGIAFVVLIFLFFFGAFAFAKFVLGF